LFKFVYKALGTEIFAATLKYSKIIIDEIQAYSPSVIAAIIYGLKIVTDMGGKFAIITATFPPVLGSLMHKYGLMADNQYEYRDFSALSNLKRHWIDIKDGDIESSPNLCVNSSFSYVVLSTLLLSSRDLTEWSLVYHSTLSYQRFYDLHSIHYDHLEGLHQLI